MSDHDMDFLAVQDSARGRTFRSSTLEKQFLLKRFKRTRTSLYFSKPENSEKSGLLVPPFAVCQLQPNQNPPLSTPSWAPR